MSKRSLSVIHWSDSLDLCNNRSKIIAKFFLDITHLGGFSIYTLSFESISKYIKNKAKTVPRFPLSFLFVLKYMNSVVNGHVPYYFTVKMPSFIKFALCNIYTS